MVSTNPELRLGKNIMIKRTSVFSLVNYMSNKEPKNPLFLDLLS